MALNISAERKVKLKGFAEGWDKAFLRVRAVSEEKRIEIGSLLKESQGDDSAEAEMERVEQLRTTARELILGGQVVSTDDDGKSRDITFHASNIEDLEAVVTALNIYWLQEVLFVAAGLDHLRS